MRNFLCKGSFFSPPPLAAGEARDGEVATWAVPGATLNLTLKPDSSGLLPGAWAVVEQNWDEAQQEGLKVDRTGLEMSCKESELRLNSGTARLSLIRVLSP